MMKLRYIHCDRGFTLIELLVAIAITGVVITLTGSGLYTLMNANQRSQIETSERLELEQALAFMTDEIKMSKQIDIAPESYKIRNFIPALDSEKFIPIIVLTPPTNSKLPNRIVYYIAIPPKQSVWMGKRVIYRWGPTLLQNGNYSDGKGEDIATIPEGAPIEYYNEVLIDRIGDTASDEAKTGCDSNYLNPVPIVTKRIGFYACVSADGKSVKLWMHKQPNSSGKSQSLNAVVRTRSN